MALFFVLAWAANIVALAVADWLFSGVSIDGWGPLLIGAAVLIRPDGHIAWAGDGAQTGLSDALETWFGV